MGTPPTHCISIVCKPKGIISKFLDFVIVLIWTTFVAKTVWSKLLISSIFGRFLINALCLACWYLTKGRTFSYFQYFAHCWLMLVLHALITCRWLDPIHLKTVKWKLKHNTWIARESWIEPWKNVKNDQKVAQDRYYRGEKNIRHACRKITALVNRCNASSYCMNCIVFVRPESQYTVHDPG